MRNLEFDTPNFTHIPLLGVNVKNIRKFVVLSLFVTGFGISSFVTPVGATAQIPTALPSNAVIHKGKGEVMIWAEVLVAARRLLNSSKLIFSTGGGHPGSSVQLSDKALD
jgi:hypothetical protein